MTYQRFISNIKKLGNQELRNAVIENAKLIKIV